MAKAPNRAPDQDIDAAAEAAAADAAASGVFRRQIRFWLISAIILAIFLYVFSGILLPFVAGMVLAYFLDPVADRLQRLGLSRLMATIVILFAFIVVLVLAFVILIPVLASQMADFASKLPEYLTRLQSPDHQLRSEMAGRAIRRRRQWPARRVEFAADLRLRPADHGVHLDLELRRGAGLGGQPVRRHARRCLLHAARLGSHGGDCRQLGAARLCPDRQGNRQRHQHRHRRLCARPGHAVPGTGRHVCHRPDA